MAESNDSSSRPDPCPSLPADKPEEAKAPARSPNWDPEDDEDIERCIQDVDPSRGTVVSRIGGCNLDCCHCAIRWYARRILHQKEN